MIIISDDRFLLYVCVSVSAFASLVDVLFSIASSALGIRDLCDHCRN